MDHPNRIYHFRDAKGFYTRWGFCVFKGSIARAMTAKGFPRYQAGYNKLRELLISHGVLARESPLDDFKFTEDYTFSSPSEAACVVAGQSRSGPLCWE